MEWNNDKELFELLKKELYTPVVGDILDGEGRYHQILNPSIKPMKDDMVVVGRAMPVIMSDVFEEQKKPFGLLTEALDQLEEGEIYISSGGMQRSAYWGEILTCTARVRGAVGAVISGYHRDTPMILDQNWPVFSMGSYTQDSGVRSAVTDYRCTIEIDGVVIQPGDLIFGDVDGVVIVPKNLVDIVIEKALEKARGEKTVRDAIENGMSSTDAFKKYGIL